MGVDGVSVSALKSARPMGAGGGGVGRQLGVRREDRGRLEARWES